MKIPPRPRTERLLSLPLLLRAYLFLGLMESVIAMCAFFSFLRYNGWTWGTPLNWSDPLYMQATTVTFAAIVFGQVASVFACRSERISIFRLGFLSNSFVIWGIAVELVILAIIAYTPIGNAIFATRPIPLWIFGPMIIGAVCLLLAEEGRKLLAERLRAWPPLTSRLKPRQGSKNE